MMSNFGARSAPEPPWPPEPGANFSTSVAEDLAMWGQFNHIINLSLHLVLFLASERA